VPIPEEAYPDRNEPEKFKKIVEGFMQPRIIAAAMRLGGVVIPAVGVLVWAAVKYGPSALEAVKRLS
jgi:hypothetical protein